MNNNIILGVTGSIAAYKAADICSKLTSKGFNVSVVMTENAQKLICAKTFLTLSKNPVVNDLWNTDNWRPRHVDLADSASLLVVAPATANFIAKYAHGIADDALSTVALAFEGRILIAPAMNPKMWRNSALQNNVASLRNRGVAIVGPVEGKVACGQDRSHGRMAEVSEILRTIESLMV